MDSKACTKCGAVKPLSEFSGNKSKYCKVKGFDNICKECKRLQSKLWHNANIDYQCYELLKQQGFTRDQITPELIALKREQLEIKRMAKELKNAVKEQEK